MTTPSKEKHSTPTIDQKGFEEFLSKQIPKTVSFFCKETRSIALFHLLFATLGFVMLTTIILFFPFFAKSALLAICFAALFLTAFSYFVLRFYFESKRPSIFNSVKSSFVRTTVETCHLLGIATTTPFIVRAIYRLIQALEGVEATYYPLEITSLKPIATKFSIWSHWKDLFELKEQLHQFAIERKLEAVKEKPLDSERHASLGASYIAYYKLFLSPSLQGELILYPFIAKFYEQEETEKKFKQTARKALEEFKIVDFFTPHDAWVHTQLAAIYHDLGMIQEEIREYEFLSSKSPDNIDITTRLGILYFQKGETARGLKIYEQLQKLQPTKASELLFFYDRLHKNILEVQNR